MSRRTVPHNPDLHQPRAQSEAITVRDLAKTFTVPVRDAGLGAAVRGFFNRQKRDIVAVGGISFSIDAGEVVGFLGPNGAGKTTTLKMMAGLLYPSAGEVTVLGHTPVHRRREYLRDIALVMGNRNQLQWDLPAADSFELNRAIYRVSLAKFRRARDELVELLEIGDLLTKPVRNLSLGERMKVELAGALLHRPSVLFLDEPSLGLDLTMQRRIRAFISDYNRRSGATVVLTSHYMADIEALCRRVIIIDRGRITFDGELARLGERFTAHKVIEVSLAAPADLSRYGHVLDDDGDRARLRIPRPQVPAVLADLLARHVVTDIAVAEPPIEDVMELVFANADGAGPDGVQP
ncbi:ABC transporter ATP-binding protein [Kibdelosporangium aridum]|uniref:ABC transporter ATP-binding protein n=1 Tax=Kibdelosporangium aridum TaxID=2030 RepID=UPI00068BBE80